MDTLRQRKAVGWNIWGPNSGGGESVYLMDGTVYRVVYGDESPLPLGAEHVAASWPAATYVTQFGHHPNHARAVAAVRAILDGTAPG